jgi:hypothetical protein
LGGKNQFGFNLTAEEKWEEPQNIVNLKERGGSHERHFERDPKTILKK